MQILRTFKNLGLAACFLHGLTEHSYSMLCAQTVVGTEPGASTIQIAPGEITTFHVAGLQLQLDQTIFVKDRPLPTEVAGISLRLRSLETEDLFNVPIFSLRQIDDCPVGMSQPNCRSTLITVHIPVNLKPVGYFSRSPGYPQRELATFRLEISESGVIISSVPVFPVRNHIRILTTCDFVFELNELSDGGCVNIVRHPDGTLAQSLALGQKFSVYVTGIGYGDNEGRLRTGEPSPDHYCPAIS